MVYIWYTAEFASTRYTYDFWMAKISFSVRKSVASEIVVRSKKASGRHHSSFLSRDTFPDSVGTHFEMSG